VRACAGLQVTNITDLDISDQDPPISAEVQTALLAALQVNAKKISVLGKRTRDEDQDQDQDEDEED